MAASSHREEIEGLRGLAVCLVLGYHLGLAWLPGGFVGVDVFFVISGFLITGILTKGAGAPGVGASGAGASCAGLWSFWSRRARRLLPAYLATLAACFLAAAVLLDLTAFRAFCGEMLAALLGLSNIAYMASEGGYFHAVAFYRPILHSWSLGVEFQFYLLWPLVILLGARWGGGRALFPLVLLLGGLSFLWAMALAYAAAIGLSGFLHALGVTEELRSSINFYLLPSRLFEFALGALLALRGGERIGRGVASTLFAIGLAAILWGAWAARPQGGYPTLVALAPALGAALIIAAGPAPFIGRLLTNPLATGLGQLSYALYLVHWPLIAFSYVAGAPPFSAGSKLLLAAAALGLASLLYLLFDRPFRSLAPAGGILGRVRARWLTAGLALPLSLLAATAWLGDGWAWRYPPSVAQYLLAGEVGRKGYLEGSRYPLCLVDTTATSLPPGMEEACLTKDPGKPNVLIFGDSYAAALMPGLQWNFPGVHFLQATGGWCRPMAAEFRKSNVSLGACDALTGRVEALLRQEGIDAVIAAARWTGGGPPFADDSAGLADLDRTLEARGIPLFIFGPSPDIEGDTLRIAAKAGSLAEINRELNRLAEPVNWRVERLFREAARQQGWRYLSIMGFFYPEGEGQPGDFLIEGSLPHSFDQGHLTSAASRAVIAWSKEQGLSFD